MGSVRKLALFVVIGLIAISTAVTVYTANEPNRRGNETGEQENVAIERGTSLYITYCLQCHGASGLGSMGEEENAQGQRRTGAALNQSLIPESAHPNLKAVFQSDDPVMQTQAEDFIRFRIMYGSPAEAQTYQQPVENITMPAFRHDLNVEELNDLVYLIMHGDWNYVYNTSVHQTGQTYCQELIDNGEQIPEMCEGDMHDAVAFPTVPPAADAETAATPDAGGDTGGDTGDTGSTGSGTEHQVIATDNAYDVATITAKPGDTITLTNNGFVQHDIAVDELGINSDLISNGQTITVTIPEDAEPGDYEFYCTVAGHKEAGMFGTLTIEAP